MWRGGNRKNGYPPQTAYLALGVQLSLLASLSLQVSVVKLQRLNNKVRLLSSGYGFRNELGYPFITEAGFSFWFGFSSSIIDWITSLVSFPSCINFFILIACASDGVASLYSIASSRCTAVPRTDKRFQRQDEKQSVCHLPFAEFRNKLGQADKSEDLIFTFSDFFGKFITRSSKL